MYSGGKRIAFYNKYCYFNRQSGKAPGRPFSRGTLGLILNMKTRKLYWIVILLTSLGFITKLDFTQNWGCLYLDESYLLPYRAAFTGVSLSLLYIGLKVKNERSKLLITTGELIFWISLLLILKGGYAVGIGGVPKETILLYDFISLLVRLILLFGLTEFTDLTAAKYVRIPLAIVLAVAILYTKTEFLALPVIGIG